MNPESTHPLRETQLTSERIFSGRIINLRLDEARLSSGIIARREVVDHPGAVALVAMPDRDHVLLVEQWRYAADEALLEIPAGTLTPGEDPAACALRELAEETGCTTANLTPLVSFWSAPGFTTERMYVFLAQGLTPCHADADEDEIIHPLTVAWQDALAMCLDGRIRDAKSIAGILAADRVLAKQ